MEAGEYTWNVWNIRLVIKGKKGHILGYKGAKKPLGVSNSRKKGILGVKYRKPLTGKRASWGSARYCKLSNQ